MLKEEQELSLAEIAIETGLSGEKIEEELQALINSNLIHTMEREGDRTLAYQIV